MSWANQTAGAVGLTLTKTVLSCVTQPVAWWFASAMFDVASGLRSVLARAVDRTP